MVNTPQELDALRRKVELARQQRAGGQPSTLPPSQTMPPGRRGPPATQQFPTLQDLGGGARIVDLGGGRKGYASPGYATSNPREVARLAGGMPETPQFGQMEQLVQQNPVMSRVGEFARGVPFARGFVDELAGMFRGPENQAISRKLSTAMQTTRPTETMGYNILGGTVATAPLMVGAAPTGAAAALTQSAERARPMLMRMIPGAAAGVAGGTAEGTVAGFGMGEGNAVQRSQRAQQEGATGAGFGALGGAAAPVIGSVIGGAARMAQGGMDALRNVPRMMQQVDNRSLAQRLGVSPQAAEVVQQAVQTEGPQAIARLQRLGPEARLAEAGPASARQLDVAITGGIEAPRLVEEALGPRFARDLQDTNNTLTRFLGPPQGREEIAQELREEFRPITGAEYRAAYSQPINYAGPNGMRLEQLMQRVPPAAVQYANELMRIRGERSAQIMANVADDGTVTFQTLPDVRQLDYLTRALQAVAKQQDTQGAMGGQTPLGASNKDLAREIRTTLRTEIPEYDQALRTASDAISRQQAKDIGREMLNPRIEPDAFLREVQDLEPGQMDYVRRGLRSRLDAAINNVRQVASDPNNDARQLRELITQTSSPAARMKMSMIMPEADANALMDRLDEAMMGLELRAAIARNSATAQRTAGQARVTAQTEPGWFQTALSGRPLKSFERLVGSLTGNTAEARALREAGIHDEVAFALTNITGQEARDALALINQTRQGRNITARQQAFIARVLARPAGMATYTGLSAQNDLQSMSDDQLNAELRRLGY